MSHRNSEKVRRSLAKPSEIAEYLRVKEETLAQWRWQKVGPRWTKVGSAVRYRWDDVESYLDAQAQDGAA